MLEVLTILKIFQMDGVSNPIQQVPNSEIEKFFFWIYIFVDIARF